MSYTLPQVQVFQIFRQLPQNVVKNLNAFVFGPHYQLFRYDVAAEKALIGLGDYVDADTEYAWPSKPAGSTIDLSYVKLYAEDVLAKYLTIPASDAYEARMVAADERNKIRVDALVLKTANDHLRSVMLKSRDVQPGDHLTYSVVSGGTTYTGSSSVVSLEADQIAADVADASPKSSNTADTTATPDLATGNASVVSADSGNARMMDGPGTKVYSLDSVIPYFAGNLKEGVVSETITVTISVGGYAGTARANVTSESGAYTRTNVPIDFVSYTSGRMYLGDNLYVEFETGTYDTDGEFQVGDVYTIEVVAPFSALDASDMITAGTYTGPRDTTYVLEVLRGGAFDRTVNVIPGYTLSGVTLSAGINDPVTSDWDYWRGGDINDEYVLTCTTAGTIANAVFSVSSLTGDNATVLSFGAEDTTVDIGSRGLVGSVALVNPAYEFAVGDFIVIRVNACRPQVRITDTAGIDASAVVVPAAGVAFDLGDYGATAVFSANGNTEGGFLSTGGLCKGDVFYVAATCATDDAVKTIVMADDLPDAVTTSDNIEVTLYLVKSSLEIEGKRAQSAPDYNWTATDDVLTVFGGLQIQDASWYDIDGSLPYLDVYSASLFVEYRALMATYTDTIHSLEDSADVATTLGTVHPDNPLAQGVYDALLNSGNRAVYYMAVPSNDTTGWSSVLDKAGLTADTYAFAPLTNDTALLDLVTAHINAQSTETEKRWRIGFYGASLPVGRYVYNQSINPAGLVYMATVSASTGGNTLVKFVNSDGTPSTYTEVLSDVRAGDKVRISFATDAWGDESYSEYTVAATLTNTSLRLSSGPAAVIDVPTKVEVYRNYTTAEIADAVANQSYGFYNRRVYSVFPSTLISGGVSMAGYFGAAAVAGLCSSVAPQQGLTNIELNGFDDLPMVYSTFSRTQLNKMAEYGTLIIMQDVVGGKIYIRHQVSSAAKGRNLNETELSIVKNFDHISYYFADMLAPYIGRYNVTPSLIGALRTVIHDTIGYLGSYTDIGLLGPQLLLENTEILTLQQHPTLKDHIQCTIAIELPAPFNVMELRLVV